MSPSSPPTATSPITPTIPPSTSTSATLSRPSSGPKKDSFWTRRPSTAERARRLRERVNDVHITEEERRQAVDELRGMGLKSPRRKLSVRLRGWLGGPKGDEGEGDQSGGLAKSS